MRSSPSASEETPQLAGLRFECEVSTVHRVLLGVKVTRAPSQSRQCGEESQALIRHLSCALLVWENIRSLSRSRGEERER